MAPISVVEHNKRVSELNDRKNFLNVYYFMFIITLNIIPYSFPKYFVFSSIKMLLTLNHKTQTPFPIFNAIIL